MWMPVSGKRYTCVYPCPQQTLLIDPGILFCLMLIPPSEPVPLPPSCQLLQACQGNRYLQCLLKMLGIMRGQGILEAKSRGLVQVPSLQHCGDQFFRLICFPFFSILGFAFG